MACLLKRLVDFLGPGPSIERAGLDETVVFLAGLGRWRRLHVQACLEGDFPAVVDQCSCVVGLRGQCEVELREGSSVSALSLLELYQLIQRSNL